MDKLFILSLIYVCCTRWKFVYKWRWQCRGY